MEANDNGRLVRVLIADDHRLFADGLRMLLAADDRIDIIGQADSGEEAVRLVDALRPDLVLMDLAMPGVSGVEATRRIRETHPDTLVLILTGSAEAADLDAARASGAAGFLTKTSLSSDVASAILGLAAFVGVSRV
jgi:DNA-binding NarL/FixJ family response regulator